METSGGPHIYTIGHSNLPIDRFIELLENHSITMVVDVRSVPFSRFYPRFNRQKLFDELKKRNIVYIFKGDTLGGRITDTSCYKNKSLPDRKVNIAELIDFDELLKREWFNNGIQQVIELAALNRLALMCSEENPSRCHRNLLIARRLAEKGLKVFHIRGDGRLDNGFNEKYNE